MALAALTLLFLYLLAFGREGSAALRVWCRAAAVVLLAVTLLDGWNGAAAVPRGWTAAGPPFPMVWTPCAMAIIPPPA